MNVPLVVAAVLAVLLGVAHSYLGERYILQRLFRRGNLPDLFRRPAFTMRTLRLAWHVASMLAFGFAALLVVLASWDRAEIRTIARIIAATFALSGVMTLVMSRAMHLSWMVFFTIAALVWIAQR